MDGLYTLANHIFRFLWGEWESNPHDLSANGF